MKVLHVIPNLIKGGAQRLVVDICNELIKVKNINCAILVLSKSMNEFSWCTNKIKVVHCEIKFQLSLIKKNHIDISEYENFVNDFDPDIIHSHLYFSELICHEKPRLKIKYISHLHSNRSVFEKKNLFNFISRKSIYEIYEKRRLHKKYLKCNKKFISISSDTTNFFNSTMQTFSNKLITLPNAISLSRFTFQNPVSLPLESIKLVTVGSLIPKKNQIFLIKVVNYIKHRNYQVHLNIIGDGPERQRIEEEIKKFDLKTNVQMSGNKDFIEEELKKSDFYVHSATYEPFGLVILEAMASKLPVISLNGTGNLDIINDKIDGFLINEINPIIFGDCIINLFNNKIKYQTISKKAFEKSLLYGMKNYANQLVKIYKN
jgi:glycosyltransferase involved in cell wall biosynthesis